MPDIYGNPTEAERRGQYNNTLAQPYVYTPEIAAAVKARNDAAKRGEGTVSFYNADGTSRTVTGSELRSSSDPQLVQYRLDAINRGVSDPNLLFGPPEGRVMSDAEKQYRHAYHNFMRNPNKGVDSNEALRAVAIWATTAIGGGYLAGLRAAAQAGTAAAGAAGAGSGAGAGSTAGGVAGGSGAGAAGGAAAGGAGAGAAGTAGAALPEIVVTGTVPAGISAGEAAAIGAGAAAGGGLASGFGSGQGTYDGNYSMGNASDYGAANKGLVLDGGAGTGVPDWLSGLGGGGGTAGGSGVAGGASSSSLWDDLIPLAGQLVGSYLEGKGAKDASRAQVAASMAALAEQRRQFDLSRSDQMPWLDAGRSALSRLQDPNAFTTSPGYNFVRAEGNRDIGNGFAARGGALSGNALRALDQYNTNLASQEYNNWFNQQASLAGIGQASAQSLGALGQNNANMASNILQNQGNARASGILGQTDAYTNGLNQLGQWYGNYRRSRQGAY